MLWGGGGRGQQSAHFSHLCFENQLTEPAFICVCNMCVCALMCVCTCVCVFFLSLSLFLCVCLCAGERERIRVGELLQSRAVLQLLLTCRKKYR